MDKLFKTDLFDRSQLKRNIITYLSSQLISHDLSKFLKNHCQSTDVFFRKANGSLEIISFYFRLLSFFEFF
ncbi:Uncharacterised protein [Mycobacteroides abscessus subsp. abscessus]|nr:Uncharacterised protein [Mycobacteroides abscessus subsp. abscessus]